MVLFSYKITSAKCDTNKTHLYCQSHMEMERERAIKCVRESILGMEKTFLEAVFISRCLSSILARDRRNPEA